MAKFEKWGELRKDKFFTEYSTVDGYRYRIQTDPDFVARTNRSVRLQYWWRKRILSLCDKKIRERYYGTYGSAWTIFLEGIHYWNWPGVKQYRELMYWLQMLRCMVQNYSRNPYYFNHLDELIRFVHGLQASNGPQPVIPPETTVGSGGH